MGHNEDRELVPLKSDFDVVWRGYRRSQVQFFIQQTETEVRILTEDRDSALSQVEELSSQLGEARAEIEGLRQQLDEISRSPIDESALSDRLRRMVRLANDEAEEVVSSARATAEHEWNRAEEAAAELRGRYQRLVADADEWRQQAEVQRNESMEQTRNDIERMAREAEAHRRKLDADAEARRTKVEEEFEVSMASRRQEAMRVVAEQEQASRQEAQRRIREATAEAERRIRLADEHAEAMRRVRQDLAERVRSAQNMLTEAEPLLGPSAEGTETREAEDYVMASVHNGHTRPWEQEQEVSVPQQREPESGLEPAAEKPVAQEDAVTDEEQVSVAASDSESTAASS